MRLRLPKAFISTQDEYRANLSGLNTFFGAVLGFVISGVEQLGTLAFTQILIVTSAAVIGILYVSTGRHRFAFAVMSLLIIVLLPRALPDGTALPDKLQPTLYVWLALTLFIELLPRHRPPAAEPTNS